MKQSTIEKNNTKFNALPKAKKRVEIAKDVLALMKNGTIIAGSGYLDQEVFEEYENMEEDSVSLQKILIEEPIACEVCQKGAIFLATVHKRNKLSFRYSDEIPSDSSSIVDEINDIFTEEQLHLMECAYEGTLMSDHRKYSHKNYEMKPVWERALYFHDTHKVRVNSKEIMILISQNIIDNKGTFKP